MIQTEVEKEKENKWKWWIRKCQVSNNLLQNFLLREFFETVNVVENLFLNYASNVHIFTVRHKTAPEKERKFLIKKC